MPQVYNVVLSCDHPGCKSSLHLSGSAHVFSGMSDFGAHALAKAAEKEWTWAGGTVAGDLCYCPDHRRPS